MASKIWFIRNEEDEPLGAFLSKHEAELEMDSLDREESGEGEYSIYAVEVDDLEDYPDEMEIATQEGLV